MTGTISDVRYPHKIIQFTQFDLNGIGFKTIIVEVRNLWRKNAKFSPNVITSMGWRKTYCFWKYISSCDERLDVKQIMEGKIEYSHMFICLYSF